MSKALTTNNNDNNNMNYCFLSGCVCWHGNDWDEGYIAGWRCTGQTGE